MTIIEPRIDAQPTATPGLRKLYYAAHTYMILGLVSGLAYREITKINHFTGDTQLGLLHTHLLALIGKRLPQHAPAQANARAWRSTIPGPDPTFVSPGAK